MPLESVNSAPATDGRDHRQQSKNHGPSVRPARLGAVGQLHTRHTSSSSRQPAAEWEVGTCSLPGHAADVAEQGSTPEYRVACITASPAIKALPDGARRCSRSSNNSGRSRVLQGLTRSADHYVIDRSGAAQQAIRGCGLSAIKRFVTLAATPQLPPSITAKYNKSRARLLGWRACPPVAALQSRQAVLFAARRGLA